MIRISESLATSQLDDELVLLDSSTGKYFGLNPVGSRIFQLLKETGDTEKVVEGLRAEYDVSEARLRSDVYDFIKTLSDRGFITSDERQL